MNINKLQKLVMQQAKDKGFGVSPDDIIVAEKIALLHSEISEVYEAFLKNDFDGSQGVYFELGDILQRILHLGGIFEIDFFNLPFVDLEYLVDFSFEGKILRLHILTSEAFEYYRCNQLDKFKESLIYLLLTTIEISKEHDFSLEEVVLKKIKNNKDREWDKDKMNEKLV